MPRAKVTFESHFESIYGSRWPGLLSSLERPSRKVALWNRHVKFPKSMMEEAGLVEKVLPSGIGYFVSEDPEVEELPPPPRDENGILAYYLLDLASVLVVEALQADAFHKVLDLCAAPGGKSVVLSQYLTAGAALTCNEFNGERCKRLRRTLQDHIPTSTHEVTVTQKNGTNWHMPEAFDRVLIDAPCSSERHLVTQHDGLARWSPKTTQEQAEVQLTLLLRGLETLKVGGRLVYSTCSISPTENDDLVRAALKRTRCGVELVPLVLEGAEPTALGASMHLPDAANGLGPMYCCVLQRVTAMRRDSDSDDDSDDSDEESD